ncbi:MULTISPECIES: ABC transporter transmembrane domain-containing protein [Pseudonocardia]|uniref:ABC transporter permease n=2 Tax=Pseudonocardia TaxID=1847 RepID=A0ABQ0RZC5_9PSEU|nr:MULTISPECIES: ABC transporter ATP-binding protein [Pseudonocardia]OSY37408.1 putative multidrug resistance ABC transporter ATP-binding/permease protein YheI [Pseudonocardia autotrophica]TDN77267.1 ATP-binding cassette subfamily B protein/ATP-binding cassette subfamily C protein CydC [Pseudonocardia autotrophica]BBG01286.1 ABC transporter permease [Pseudonocardia autotrophica]GEC26013.1 ABC transporter permease [Pseudonocardia saturnea]
MRTQRTRRARTTPARSPLRTLVAAYRLRGRAVLAGWGFGVGWQGAQVLAPLVVAAAVDQGIVGRDPWALGAWSAVLVGLCVIEMTLTALRHRFAIIPAVQISLRLREDLLARAHRAEPAGTGRSPGDLVARSTSDVDTVGGMVDFTPSTMACLVSTAAVTGTLVLIDPLLAAAVLVPLLPVGIAFWWWSRRLQDAARAAQRSAAALSTLAEAGLDNDRIVHGMGAVGALHARWDDAVGAARRDGLRLGRLRSLLLPVVELLRVVAAVAVLLVGARLLAADRISVGELVAAASYVVYLGPLLSQIGAFVAEWRGALASAARIESAVPQPHRARTGPELPPAGPAGRHLRAEGLTVAGTRIHGLDLDIAPGTVCAVLGGTDDGLPELAEVLTGRRAPDGGRVRLDGVDVTGRPLAEIGEVGRSAFLFSGTIGESVTFARPDASHGDVAAALARSRADEVLGVVPDGLGTALPPGATTLSGGQRQRIALARALVADPTVLVCTDVTAALDANTASAVVRGLRDRGRTTVLLTTDPQVAGWADREIDLRPGERSEGVPR